MIKCKYIVKNLVQVNKQFEIGKCPMMMKRNEAVLIVQAEVKKASVPSCLLEVGEKLLFFASLWFDNDFFVVCVTLVPGNTQYGPWTWRTQVLYKQISVSSGKCGQELMGGGDGLCAWTAGTLVCQKLDCSCDFIFLSSASFVGKFWDGVVRRTMWRLSEMYRKIPL